MRKVISLFITLVLCLSLFACRKDDKKPQAIITKVTDAPTLEPTPTEVPEPTAEPTPTPEPKYGSENLAFGKTVESDAVEGDYSGENAVDGDYFTRWSAFAQSTDYDLHFLKIDLGETYKVGCVAITWESCQASFFLELLDENGTRADYLYCDAAGEDLFTETFFNGKMARYVVLHVSKTSCGSPYEIEVFEQLKDDEETGDVKTNIALDGTAVCDQCEGESYTADKAIDGDYNTRWAPGGSSFDDDVIWLLDLGDVKKIEEIIIYFESNQAEYSVEIASDVNGPWDTVYEWQDTDVAGRTSISVGGKEARFVRYFREAGADGWASFYELEVISGTA